MDVRDVRDLHQSRKLVLALFEERAATGRAKIVTNQQGQTELRLVTGEIYVWIGTTSPARIRAATCVLYHFLIGHTDSTEVS